MTKPLRASRFGTHRGGVSRESRTSGGQIIVRTVHAHVGLAQRDREALNHRLLRVTNPAM